MRLSKAAFAQSPLIPLSNRYGLLSRTFDPKDTILVSLLLSPTEPSIHIDVEIFGKRDTAAATALLDSGATGNLINEDYARKVKIPLKPLTRHLLVKLADDSEGIITHYTTLGLRIQQGSHYHEETIRFYVADIGEEDIILGSKWLIKHNPEIDWAKYQLKMTRCPKSCTQNGILKIDAWESSKNCLSVSDTETPKIEKKRARRQGQHSQLPTQLWTHDDDDLETNLENHWRQFGVKIKTAKTSQREDTENPIKKFSNHAQRLAQQHLDTRTRTFEEMVPPQYQKFKKVFQERTTGKLPERKKWDHAIDLKDDFGPKGCKIYPLSPLEQTELDKWIKEHLDKGFIRPSKSPQASPFFFVGKKDGKLRPCQDYRYLNSGTIKNTYPLPLISELIDKLKGKKIFTKLDVRWGYNNIRIKKGDEWKAAFKTNRGLF